MSRFVLCLVAATLSVAPVFALGKIRVTSDVPAYVQMKGHKLGNAPLTLHDLKRGTYELQITALGTGETRTFRVSIPLVRQVIRKVDVKFTPRPPLADSLAASENRIAAKYAKQERLAPARLPIGRAGSPYARLVQGAPKPPAPPEAARPSPPPPASSLQPKAPRPSTFDAARERWTATARSWTHDRYTQRHLVAGGVVLLGAAVGSGVVAGLGIGGALVNEAIHRERDETRSHRTSQDWTKAPAR